MIMMKRKICMLGSFSVGKTSLVSRFVHSLFSEKYHTTVGVKIEKKQVVVGDSEIALLIWDLYGEDDIREVRMSYVRGSAGYLLVADGTRRETVDIARRIRTRVEATLGPVPFVLLLNKADLTDSWDVDDSMIQLLEAEGWTVVRASAKTGEGVEESFNLLASALVEHSA